MKLCFLIVVAVSLGFGEPASALEIIRDQRYVTYKMNLSEMNDPQQWAVFEDFESLLGQRLAAILPSGRDPLHLQSSITAITENSDSLNVLLAESLRSGRDIALGNGVRAVDLIPTGLFAIVGTRLSANFIAGVGGNISVGVLLVPKLVRRIDLALRTQIEYREMDWSLIGWPTGSLGAGVGGGGRPVMGAGIVWGPLDSASNFYGLAAGITGDVSAGVGSFFQAGIMRREGHFRNFFFMLGLEAGATASIETHGTLSAVIGGEELMRVISRMSGSEPSSAPTSGIDIVPASP